MLKANFNDNKQNFQDNFIGFVVEGVRSYHPSAATPDEVSTYVNSRFGLDVPSLVAKNILGRAKQKGLVTRNEDGSFQCTSRELNSGNSITADFEKFVRRQNQLSDQLLSFARSEFANQAQELNREACSKLIARYMDEHALPLLQSGVRGTAFIQGLGAEENYVVSEFVSRAYESDPEIFDLLVEVAKGATLAAVLKMDVSSLEASLNDLWVYFDTSIVLNALGYHGDAEQAASLEVLQIGKKLGIHASVFEHTVREVQSILVAAQNTIRSGSRNLEGFKVAEHFLDADYSAADLEILIARLERDIQELGIKIRPKPDDYHEYGLDEPELDRIVGESISYQSESGRRYDVDSISAVHRLRQGRAGDNLERARALFITKNRHLVNAAYRARESGSEFSIALLESTFASLLWVRRPSLAEDLPEKRILATAWAGMQPEKNRWLEYLAEADKMVERGELSHEDALLLRLSPVGRHELMKNAVGNPEKFSQVKPTELLEKLKVDLSAPLNEKIEELEAKNTLLSDTASLAIDEMNATLVSTKQALRDSEALNETLQSDRFDQRVRLYNHSHKSAARVARFSFLGVCIVVIALLAGSQLLDVQPLGQAGRINQILVLVGVVLTAIIGILSICGVNLTRLLPTLTEKIARSKYARALDRSGLQPSSPEELNELLLQSNARR